MPLDNTNVTTTVTNDNVDQVDDITTAVDTTMISSDNKTKKAKGLSVAELQDPNNIEVSIIDSEAPLVVLFGPPSCGKTMTLVRMTRYLRDVLGYTVSPIKSFRPSYDENYRDICENYTSLVNSNNAAESTDKISFMLVAVIKEGRTICQILEAPGEYYFNPEEPNAQYPTYVNKIINGSNRKIWCMMVEPDWEDQEDRRNYSNRIAKLKPRMKVKDKVVFIFNKIDLTPFVISPGNVKMNLAIKSVKDMYPGIFTPFQNVNPITSIWRSYNCDFVPFQTGDYTPSTTGLKFDQGPDEYCNKLWNVLLSKIRG